MSQNAKLLDEIRKWNTEDLTSVLYMNGLNDCVEAIKYLEIDGETFLNLTETQLLFWRKHLNAIQIRRLWSMIQLSRENPKEFIGDFKSKQSKPTPEIERNNRTPFVKSLENILGQKSTPPSQKSAPPPPVTNTTNKKDEVIYENMETILIAQGKLPYKKLPPKPPLQEQQSNIKAPIKSPNENVTKSFLYNSKPIQHVHPIIQTPNINKVIREIPFSLPSAGTTVNEVQSSSNSSASSNNHRRVPSPNANNRPLPMPPSEENRFPIPPSTVPLIPNWKLGLSASDEEFPIYDDVDDYKTKRWYSDIDRKRANELLRGKPNGTFLARPSKRDNNECSLSIVYNSRIYNLAVIRTNNRLSIGNQEFDSVNQIIEFFMENEMVLNGDNNEDIVVTLREI